MLPCISRDVGKVCREVRCAGRFITEDPVGYKSTFSFNSKLQTVWPSLPSLCCGPYAFQPFLLLFVCYHSCFKPNCVCRSFLSSMRVVRWFKGSSVARRSARRCVSLLGGQSGQRFLRGGEGRKAAPRDVPNAAGNNIPVFSWSWKSVKNNFAHTINWSSWFSSL